MKVKETIRDAVKLVTTGSVQMMIGGIVAAVMPPQVSVLYKVGAYIGGLVLAGYAGEKLDPYVDKKLDEVEEIIDDAKRVISEKNEKDEAEEMGA